MLAQHNFSFTNNQKAKTVMSTIPKIIPKVVQNLMLELECKMGNGEPDVLTNLVWPV